MVAHNTVVHNTVGDTMTQAEFEAVNSHALPTGAVLPIVVRKAADEAVNASTALQDDDELLLAVAANEVWDIRAYLTVTASATANIKLAWTVPANATIFWQSYRGTADAFETLDGATSGTATVSVTGLGAETTKAFRGSVRVVVAGTTGNVQLQWAQGTSEASSTKVRANSFLEAIKIN